MDGKKVLERIRKPAVLENAIGLISFHEGRTGDYIKLLGTAIPGHVRIVPHFIRKHADICYLPKCQLVIMFAEFSERLVLQN